MNKAKLSVLTLSLLATFVSNSSFSATDAFQELDQAAQQSQQTSAQKRAAFYDYVNQYLDEYEQWRDAYTAQLDKEKAEYITHWGTGDVSDQTTEVQYSQDQTVKKVIDYEKNQATVSVLVDTDTPDSVAEKQLNQVTLKVDNQSVSLKNAKMTQHPVNFSAEQEQVERNFIIEQTEAQMNELDNQAERLIHSNTGIPNSFIYQRAFNKKLQLIKDSKVRLAKLRTLYKARRQALGLPEPERLNEPQSSEPVQPVPTTEKKLTTNSQEKTPAEPAQPSSVVQQTPKAEKKVVTYTVDLPKKTLKERAKVYQPLAKKESEEWQINPELIMAIMHTESAFRPNAKSHVPAYGLMQVVPSSAGYDVNRQIRQIDKPMQPDELYQPPVNVETGTAYLHILNDKYLQAITNKTSRTYCMIAAYNTGAGNVARAFNPDHSTNINQAAKIINGMSSKQVYDKLINDLPYDETKNYLKKVTQRMALY